MLYFTVLASCNIICANHYKPDTKIRINERVNVSWCFLCCDLGGLIACTTCPSSYHLDCIQQHTKKIQKNAEGATEKQSTNNENENVADDEESPKIHQAPSPTDLINGNYIP